MNETLGLWTALGVGVGGGLGAASRYALDRAVTQRLRARRTQSRADAAFPWGITIVNLSGSLALGVLVGLGLADHGGSQLAILWAALGTGVLGGYTTFSTASLDTVRLLQGRRFGAALANALGTLVLGVALAMLGIWLGTALH